MEIHITMILILDAVILVQSAIHHGNLSNFALMNAKVCYIFKHINIVSFTKALTDQNYSIEIFTLCEVIGNGVVMCVKSWKNENLVT